MWELRLGDEIDDYCVKCRRLTNHSIVSMVETKAAKVRCRTCFSDHDFRNEQAPPSKKELARQKDLFNAVLAGVIPPEESPAGTTAELTREFPGEDEALPLHLNESEGAPGKRVPAEADEVSAESDKSSKAARPATKSKKKKV